ncbi:type II 3-dehydroquinate dehydratase [Fulvivirga kasyanovii]|uniref:3-dehydroquinate dehydratase n=1 Tax=Fulvivirga kasyanovii TaxID=396812 RepID=A0ABW9RLF9_9BACT|nr:type II 3-dehydroquinate dehydratase [Fulvivirga kasyanovii]MTI24924.1 type II 3-dehydroquinate dehydratase [Fulvivirga kasyanovii]
MKIIIINGPNLNLLGKREPEVYGHQSFETFFNQLKSNFSDIDIEYFQSNIEGEIVGKIQDKGFDYQGIILNAGAYTHTSVAISDAIAAVPAPVIEVHISNIYAREEFRHKSIISKECIGMISGLGLEGYLLALTYLINKDSNNG